MGVLVGLLRLQDFATVATAVELDVAQFKASGDSFTLGNPSHDSLPTMVEDGVAAWVMGRVEVEGLVQEARGECVAGSES